MSASRVHLGKKDQQTIPDNRGCRHNHTELFSNLLPQLYYIAKKSHLDAGIHRCVQKDAINMFWRIAVFHYADEKL